LSLVFWLLSRVIGSLDIWFSDCFQICWDLHKFFVSGWSLMRRWRLIFLESCRSLPHAAVYWILMGRPLLLRDRKLVSNDNSLGRVVVFSGGSNWKYLFRCLFSVFCLCTAPLICCYFFTDFCRSYAKTYLIIYLPLKKNCTSMPKYHYRIKYVINPQQFARVNRVKSRQTILTMSYAKKKILTMSCWNN
jgi:hypothetical protein